MTADPRSPTRLDAVRGVARSLPLRRALLAYLVFTTAEWANWIALLVYGYTVDGARGSGLVAALQLAPAALLSPAIAQWAGRLPAARALRVGYSVQAVSFCATGLSLLLGAPFAVVVSLAAVSSLSLTITRPVHHSILPELSYTPSELTAANSASGLAEAAGVLIGPALAAVVLAVSVPGTVPVITGVLTAMSVLLLRGMRSSTPVAHAGPAPRPRLRDLVRAPMARLSLVLTLGEYVLIGLVDVLLVVVAFEVLGLPESGLGLLNASSGVGGIVGAALAITLVGRRHLSPAVLLGALASSVPIAILAGASWLVVAMLLLAVSFGGKVFFDVSVRTLVQRAMPDEQYTATFGVAESAMSIGVVAGNLSAPFLLARIGVVPTFLVAAAIVPLTALVCLPALRRIDREAVVPHEDVELVLGVPMLRVLSPRIVERLASQLVHLDVDAGTRVVREGGHGNRFYLVEEGEVVVTQGGRELRRLGPGEWFGELALLRDVPRTATCTAVTPVRLGALGRRHFLTAVTGTPQAAEAADGHVTTTYLDHHDVVPSTTEGGPAESG